MKLNKAAKALIGLSVGCAAAYYGIGAALCVAVLSRKAVNESPEFLPDDIEGYLAEQKDNVCDDWFIMQRPEIKKLINLKGETLTCAEIKQKKHSDVWLIVCHGYNNSPKGMGAYAKGFYEKGYNVLLPYMRAHARSEQKMCTMGYYDRYDVVQWINYIVSINPNAKIVLLGVSMGAATTLLTTGEKLPDNVKCAVSDCSYTSCWDEFTVQTKEMFHLPPIVLYPANTANKIISKWDFKDCSPIEAVKKSKTPTLFIHGEKDTFVPFSMMDRLYNACIADKDKISIPNSEHAVNLDTNPELYWEKVLEFTEKYV